MNLGTGPTVVEGFAFTFFALLYYGGGGAVKAA